MVEPMEKLPLPLEGIRVLDVTHIVAGPFCSMILADLGAEVIKVERPGVGERSRSNGPFIEKPDGEKADGQRVSARFLGLNRNKKSVTLDLRDPRCKDALLNMVRVSDVLLDNWGPGALQRLGLGYEVLQGANPRLIYASITGYGDSDDLRGPYSDWPAKTTPAFRAWAAGWRSPGLPAALPRWSVTTSAIQCPAFGLPWESLWPWRHGARPAWGSTWTWPCTTVAAHTTSSMAFYQASGQTTGRARENMISAQITVRAKDGYVVVAGAGAEDKWVALWELIGRRELAEDPRFLGRGISGEFYFDQFVPIIEGWSENLSKWQVAEQLTEIGFSMGVVQDQADMDRCPHLEARKMFVDAGDGLGGSFRTVKTPIQLTACVDIPAGAPPLLGQHNQEILCSIGGLTPEELDRLNRDGLV